MPQKGSTDNGILKAGHFGLKLNIPPNLLLFSVYTHHPHLSSVRDSTFFILFAHLSTSPLLFFNHNFHRARPHFHILVAFELDQRQDGPTFLLSS
jgi:hypothetical protein